MEASNINTNLTLGYNLEGFNDEEFSGQNYYYEGIYLKVKMKFDQESVKGLVK